MIYKFKSKASGDVILLGAVADKLLGIIGKAVTPQGIIEAHQMQAAISALQAAVAEDQAHREQFPVHPERDAEEPIALHQRAWPFIDLLQRSQAAGVPVVWGA
jgi:hypothetical protein